MAGVFAPNSGVIDLKGHSVSERTSPSAWLRLSQSYRQATESAGRPGSTGEENRTAVPGADGSVGCITVERGYLKCGRCLDLLATMISLLVCNFIWGTQITIKMAFGEKYIKPYYIYHAKYGIVSVVICIITFLLCDMMPEFGMVS